MVLNRKNLLFIFTFTLTVFLGACSSTAQNGQNSSSPTSTKKEKADLSKLDRAYFASGCFWCVEAVFESVRGVEEAVSGYSGGHTQNPTYQTIGSGKTGHAEAVAVYYDASVVNFSTLVTVFFASQDPTTLNRQGPDAGTQYRSVAFYENDEQKAIIEKHIAKLEADGTYDAPIVTEVTKFEKFWEAEAYHQDFERRNPNQGYIKAVSIPRLKRFQKKHPELLKAAH